MTKQQLGFLLAFLCIFPSFLDASWFVWEKNDNKIVDDNNSRAYDRNAKLIKDVADLEIEHRAKIVWKYLEHPKKTIKLLFGGALLFCGQEFSFFAMQLQSWRVTGWPLLKQGVQELGTSYCNARKTLKNEYPNLIQAQKALSSSRDKLSLLRAELKAEKLLLKGVGGKSFEKARNQENIQRIEADIKDIKGKMAIAFASQSSFHAISQALDVKHLRTIGQGIYFSFVNAFAVSSSQLLSNIAVGLNIGNILSKITERASYYKDELVGKVDSKTDSLSRTIPAKEWDWIKSTLKFIVYGASLTAAIKFQKTSLTMGTCLLGGTLVGDVLIETVDPFLEQAGVKKLGDNTAVKNILHYGIAGIGFFSQLKYGHQAGRLFPRALLLPFITLDKKMKASPFLKK